MTRFFLIGLFLSVGLAAAGRKDQPPALAGDFFLELLAETNAGKRARMLRNIQQKWHESYIPILLEAGNMAPNRIQRMEILRVLMDQTGRDFKNGVDDWYQWIWRRKENKHPDYGEFKGKLFSRIDPTFIHYFKDRPTTIRLDEVRWGGVKRDGIPPLRNPKMIPAAEADYLEDGNVIFAVSVNGDTRAYPKRILGWHEMFVDVVGGESVCGVYCTLCGTVILYKTTHKGFNFQLGTSGFLFRSNKLMYDRGTLSLWNTLWGRPVVGPLVGKDIELERLSVVTTTWGEWRKRHPETTVLSLDTGYKRDYTEGTTYKDYFATDKLMFGVPKRDRRLKNKAEVLALTFPKHADKPLAISAKFLTKHPVYQDKMGDLSIVVLTDPSGANRVYERGELGFISVDGVKAIDEKGGIWEVGEHGLTSQSGTVLRRLPAHRSFWFAWHSAFENTRLVK